MPLCNGTDKRTDPVTCNQQKVKSGLLTKTNEELPIWLTMQGLLIIAMVVIWLFDSITNKRSDEKYEAY